MCPACDLTSLTPLADLGEMPVACGMTFPTAEAALGSAKGRMHLASCGSCGHVANIAFDPTLAPFDAAFEAALFHSPTYTAYATSVADRLVKRYDLSGKRVLELASGSDVLLEHMRGLGCDATGVPGTTAEGGFDFVLARFVLEHMADPFALLTSIRQLTSRAFIEVPDAAYDLTTAGWDCIYPHVGYFGTASIRALCTRAGWSIMDTGSSFHDQYLWAEIEATEPTASTPTASSPHTLNFAAATALWQRTLAGKRTVVWGAGTRGTMFCNRVDPLARLISGVADRNPAKHGHFLPLAGHPVVAPADLPHVRPDIVVLTNPAYRTEITAELTSLGLSPTILVA